MKNTGVKLSSLSNRKNRDKYDELTKNNIEFNNNSTKNIEIKKETQELRPNETQQIKEPEPAYYAVIPANVRYDTRLSPLAKLLYGEITCLCQKEGFCWATNAYFERLYQKSKWQIVRMINQLTEFGYITKEIEYYENTKQVKKRLLRLGGTEKKEYFYSKNATTPSSKNDTTPGSRNDTYNNTSINNTSINNKYIRAKDCASVLIEPDTESKNNKCANVQPLIENKNTEPLSTTKNKSLRKSKPKLAPKVLEEEFNTVWDLYPKKKDKTRAFKAFSKARKEGVSLEKIREGVQKYVQEIENTGIAHQYIKYGSTWFNNRCWEDEYDTDTKSSYDLNEYVKAMDTFENKSEDDEEFVDEKELEEERRKDLLFEGYEEIAPGVFYDKIFQRTEFLNKESQIAYEKNSGDSP